MRHFVLKSKSLRGEKLENVNIVAYGKMHDGLKPEIMGDNTS